MFPDVFRKDVVGAEETFARCMEGGGLGASTSLNWGCAASPTSCRMRPSLVERKAPLCLIRASATRRSTWLQRKRGCQPCGPTPGPWQTGLFLGAPSTPTCNHSSGDPLTCGRSRRPPPHGPAAPDPGGPGLCSGGREKSGPTPARNGGPGWGTGILGWDEGARAGQKAPPPLTMGS